MGTVGKLELRTYQKGDAEHMAAVFNAVMKGKPGFQEDSVARLEQVYAAPSFDPESKQIALLDGRFVGYMTTTPDPSDPVRGNLNYPYVLPEAGDDVRSALFSAGMRYLKNKGVKELGTAYFHEGWHDQLAVLEGHGFERRSVRYRVLEGPVPAPSSVVATAPVALRPAVPADFERMCIIDHEAVGKCTDPPAIRPADFQRLSAAPFIAKNSLTVAERDRDLLGFMGAYVLPAKEGEPSVAIFHGPKLLPDAWNTPARDALWATGVRLVSEAGAKIVKSYAPDAATPETERLLQLYADNGITGDELWVHLHRPMDAS
jgi:hypothetical protein